MMSNLNIIHIEYFPSYSPELDPTEQSWRAIKKWLGIRYWRDKNEFKEELITGLKQDFVTVPIYDYLLP
jgi:transposase